jgi:aryl-alcohol dehydrogenase-like predicted oxidoreductase
MNYRNLGSSGARVSELCLGAMTFGEADDESFMHQVGCTEAVSMDLMDRALDLGIGFWDTANVYGQDGLSERIIGNWFEARGRRDEVVLATKFRFTMGEGVNDRGASRLHIMQAVEASLRRLKTDHIDLYQVHMQDIRAQEEEVLRALDDLIQQGKVRYFGCSNYAAYRLVESLWISDKRNLNRHVTLQARYNLLSRELEYEHIPAMRRFGLGLLAWSPLASGMLTGKYSREGEQPKGARLTKWEGRREGMNEDRTWAVVDALTEAAKSLETTPAAVALAWLLTRPTVSSVIFGARTVEQLEANAAAAELTLPDEVVATLDEVSAPPVRHPYDFLHRVDGDW